MREGQTEGKETRKRWVDGRKKKEGKGGGRERGPSFCFDSNLRAAVLRLARRAPFCGEVFRLDLVPKLMSLLVVMAVRSMIPAEPCVARLP